MILFFIYFYLPDIETERTHVNMEEGIKCFDKKSMKQVETKEKITLPGKEGNFLLNQLIVLIVA